MTPRIEFHKTRAKQPIHVTYLGKNGQKLAPSENVTTRANAIKNVKAMARLFLKMWGIEPVGLSVEITDFTKVKTGVKVVLSL